VAVLSAALGIVIHATGLFHRSELGTIDARFRIRGPQPALVRDVVIVGVDFPTFNTFNARHIYDTWPFPRRYHARVIDELLRAGAREIAFDIQFTTPTDTRDDDSLAAAVGRARHMVLATVIVGPHGSTNVLGGDANLRAIDARAADASVVADSDGVIRRMRYEIGGLDTFPVVVAQEATNRLIPASLFGGPTNLVPIDFAGPPHTVREIPYSSVYLGRFPASAVRGKIVIVGATASILQDTHETATTGRGAHGTGGVMSGPEVEANEIASVLLGLPLKQAPGWANLLAILLLSSVAPVLGLRGWALRGLLAALIVACAYAVVCQVAFNAGWILSFVDPLVALAISAVGTLGVVYLSEAFERQYARTVFGRFVPPSVVDEVLARTDDDLRLGGLERVCTVMFTDLRGFTSFSETQPAARVIEVVNTYLNEMTEAILDAGGTLIAYMGDGIMAVFGAPLDQPDHADRALVAAREMLTVRLPRFNGWLRERGFQSEFRMGIGLNTGPVMAGNVGAMQRVEYTAIGDTTNTASRLEGMTKGQQHMLFMSESTCAALQAPPDDLEFVGEFEIRGRTTKLAVYSIPDPPVESGEVAEELSRPESAAQPDRAP
jgi:adenylate cyclase